MYLENSLQSICSIFRNMNLMLYFQTTDSPYMFRKAGNNSTLVSLSFSMIFLLMLLVKPSEEVWSWKICHRYGQWLDFGIKSRLEIWGASFPPLAFQHFMCSWRNSADNRTSYTISWRFFKPIVWNYGDEKTENDYLWTIWKLFINFDVDIRNNQAGTINIIIVDSQGRLEIHTARYLVSI